MYLKNVDSGLCNGTRLVVTKISRSKGEPPVTAKIITGVDVGRLVDINYQSHSQIVTIGNVEISLTRNQLPIQLAFAMTINRAQGQTFDKVGIFLREPAFTHGQLYTAFSRVRRASDVKVQIVKGKRQGDRREGRVYTRNIVFKTFLWDAFDNRD
jgi:hypothetical protein